MLSDEEEQKIGELLKVRASGPGEWSKYSIHLIDALFDRLKLSQAKLERVTRGGIVLKSPICPTIELNIDSGMTKRVFTFCYEGSKGVVEKRFDDTFESFRAALAFFVAGDCSKVAGQFWSRYKDITAIIENEGPKNEENFTRWGKRDDRIFLGQRIGAGGTTGFAYLHRQKKIC